MHLRVVLRVPGGDAITRDTRDGLWAEPWGTPEETTPPDLWALPGLIDAHAHLARETMDRLPGNLEGARARAAAALRAGVGLIIDKGWMDLTTVQLIDKMPEAERPDIEAAGAILAVPGGFWDGFARIVPEAGMAEAVSTAADEGRGWVKLIGDWPRKGIGPLSNFTEGELAVAVAVAEAHGSRVAVHTMAREVPAMAVRAGVHSIEHGLFLDHDDLELLGARGGSWVPTVIQVESVIRQLGEESSGGRLLREGLERVRANLGPAVESRVRVLTGTDLAVGTDQVAREAIRLFQLGMPPRAVVEAASSSRLGPVSSLFESGAPANAVLFAQDPLLDPNVLAHPVTIIRMGRIVR